VPEHPEGQVCEVDEGQVAELPLHTAGSVTTPLVQLPTRHTVPAGSNTSEGQVLLTPSQVSATSQPPPLAARHTTEFGCLASAGHRDDVPSQVSAASHTPSELRQVLPALPAACWQLSPDPVQRSVVHGFASSAHGVAAGFFESEGQALLTPSHVSA
jgi:hypothetical protein